jgi:hypothetical protein
MGYGTDQAWMKFAEIAANPTPPQIAFERPEPGAF